ncbi:hypothetical protein QWY85_19380 [Neolewinella lacunae]|uniref:Phosphatidylinositol diacylglycerol-lyase n=1 Tax=Neolewinella lacunae TaxID=1517758 RepID=A0A923PLB5_9BACT|nr:hypothetical protein [Neolewinella lacunae]MBC6993318.1 hypothetical protein [Neolewinella lacunae]MDN3636841.1 hypothetical protein [Neolewinella lacunae]
MKNVMYGLPKQYDSGSLPAVALNGSNHYVEVHKSQNNSNLWYNYGLMAATNNVLGTSNKTNAQTNGSGYFPSVSMNDNGTVVLVFQDSNPSSGVSALKYQVGIVSGDHISWGAELAIGINGLKPTVALSSGSDLIFAYESDSSGTLQMKYGTVDTNAKTIDWFAGLPYSTGHTPHLAVNNSNTILETHDLNGIVYYSVGTIDFSQKSIVWGQHDYVAVSSHGQHDACIALNDHGEALLLYQLQKASAGDAQEGANHFWDEVIDAYDYLTNADVYGTFLKVGYVSGSGYNTKANWMDPKFVGWGNKPSIACNDAFSLIAQLSAAKLNDENRIVGNSSDLLFYLSKVMDMGDYTDRANWMHNNFLDVSLKNMVIPGAHDAGMYTTHNCTVASEDSTKTQSKNFADMLQSGIRYFDIRPSRSLNNTFYCYHSTAGMGCYGASISDILNDVSAFLRQSKEVVILKFSHYDFPGGNSDKWDLEREVSSALSGMLLSPSDKQGRIANMTLRQILGNSTNGIAIPVFLPYSSSDSSADYSGLYTYADYDPSHNNATAADLVVYDKYSDDNSLNDMRKDQLHKLHSSSNHGGDLFLLSWTLTQQIFEGMTFHFDQLNSSIEDFAKLANSTCTQVLSDQQQTQQITTSKLPNVVYVDFCDNFVTDICVWLNFCLKNGYINR